MMKLGIIISTNEPETVWNAYRLANFSLNKGDKVKVFLLSKGVESEIEDEKYNIKEQLSQFLSRGGEIYACETCMKSRLINNKETCPLSTINELYQIIKECDKILTFG